MSSANDKNSGPAAGHRDVLGGPDPAEHEDIVAPTGRDPHSGPDIMGGPDDLGPSEVLSDPEIPPRRPARRDTLGGPDDVGPEDIMGPPA